MIVTSYKILGKVLFFTEQNNHQMGVLELHMIIYAVQWTYLIG